MENKKLDEQKYIRAQKKVKAIKGFYVHLMVYLAVNAFIILARIFSGDGVIVVVEIESYSTLFFWGIGIAFHAFSVFGMDLIFGTEWENRKIKKMMDRDKKEFWE